MISLIQETREAMEKMLAFIHRQVLPHDGSLAAADVEALCIALVRESSLLLAETPAPSPDWSDAVVKRMVDRFLSWRLPEDFSPDGGISFKAEFNEGTAYPMRHEPIGTNLFTATQAEAMVRHIIGAPASVSAPPAHPSQDEPTG